MSRCKMLQVFLLGLIGLVLVSIASAFAANLEVEDSSIGKVQPGMSANQIKPPECTQNLTNIVSGAGTIHGTSENDLILGGSSDDEIYGYGGDDCILSGSGDDIIDGGEGNDTCLGGTGNNTYIECEYINP
jgi:Ca2+-binding RTX toxin-like protein